MLQRLAAPFSKLPAPVGRKLRLGAPPRAPVPAFHLEGGDRRLDRILGLDDATLPTHKLLRQAVLDSLAPPV